MAKKKNIIFHYCSVEAFHSIITSKSFWLFSLSSSNDLKEMTEAKKVIYKILSEEKYKNINKPDIHKHEFYSLSCTSKKDNAFHFCKYADNERGVCLGIDTAIFKKYFNRNLPLDWHDDYLSFEEVIYDDKQGETAIRNNLEQRLLNIEQPRKEKNKLRKALWNEIPEQLKNELKEQIPTDMLFHFEPILKTINYKDESEVRLLFNRNQFQLRKEKYKGNFNANNPIIKKFRDAPSRRNFENAKVNGKGVEALFAYAYDILIKSAEKMKFNDLPKFRVVSGVIRKHIELNMEYIWDKQPIKKVILGPNCKTDIKEINEFLKANKILCEAEKSSIMNRK